jgi:NAD(P)-dependent dehydrogenase (short-subunit alcohol dehydrogenase family)
MGDAVVVVGGATGALGRAVVARLCADGWRCAALSRHAEAAGDLPVGATHVQCDLSDAAQVEELAVRIGAIGTWTAAVNCSGGYAAGRAHEVDDAAMLHQLELNLLGPWRLAKAAAQAMLAHRGGGRIVFTVGRAAVDAQPNQAGYQLAKVALARLVEVMARELRDDAVTVNGVLPSTMDTPANRAAMPRADAQRWVPVAEVAGVIAWLLSGESSAVSGALVPVYGRA